MDEEKTEAVEETVETEETEAVEAEVSEERARIDELGADNTEKILAAIGEMRELIEGVRESISAFVDFGGTVREYYDEGENISANSDDSLAEDIAEAIDADVIKDLDNFEWE